MNSVPTSQTQATDRDQAEPYAASTSTVAETERERIRAAARDAAAQFPPMSNELVTLVRNTLRGRTQ